MGGTADPQGLWTLSYVSHARIGARAPEMLDLCRSSLRNNPRFGLTGALYYDGRHFFQTLEGPRQAVETLLETIRRDWRHCGVVVADRGPLAARRFGDWSMRFLDADRLPDLARDFPIGPLAKGCRDTAEAVARRLAAA